MTRRNKYFIVLFFCVLCFCMTSCETQTQEEITTEIKVNLQYLENNYASYKKISTDYRDHIKDMKALSAMGEKEASTESFLKAQNLQEEYTSYSEKFNPLLRETKSLLFHLKDSMMYECYKDSFLLYSDAVNF
jgi:hypothetical protein